MAASEPGATKGLELSFRKSGERSGFLQVRGGAQDALTCEWAHAGTSTFHETSVRPAHEDGVWEIGPVQLDLDVDFRISLNGVQHLRNLKTIPDGAMQPKNTFGFCIEACEEAAKATQEVPAKAGSETVELEMLRSLVKQQEAAAKNLLEEHELKEQQWTEREREIVKQLQEAEEQAAQVPRLERQVQQAEEQAAQVPRLERQVQEISASLQISQKRVVELSSLKGFLSDRTHVVAEACVARIRARQASARKAIEDSREFVEETKDWALSQSERARGNIVAVLLTAAQVGHSMGSRVIGQEKTAFVFSKLRFPQQLQVNSPDLKSPQVESEIKLIAG